VQVCGTSLSVQHANTTEKLHRHELWLSCSLTFRWKPREGSRAQLCQSASTCDAVVRPLQLRPAPICQTDSADTQTHTRVRSHSGVQHNSHEQLLLKRRGKVIVQTCRGGRAAEKSERRTAHPDSTHTHTHTHTHTCTQQQHTRSHLHIAHHTSTRTLFCRVESYCCHGAKPNEYAALRPGAAPSFVAHLTYTTVVGLLAFCALGLSRQNR
jgi:hypothetical protein